MVMSLYTVGNKNIKYLLCRLKTIAAQLTQHTAHRS